MFAELKKIEAEWRARIHKALSFDGVNDYVELPDSASLDLTILSIAIGVKTTQTGTPFIRFFSRKDTTSWPENPYQLGFHATTGKPTIIIGDGTNCDICEGASDIRDGKWHFIVGTVDGRNLKIYVDGILENTTTQKITPFDYDGPAMIGRAYNKYFNGLITHVSIYNRALSASEIKYLYHNPFDPIDPEHLVLWLNPAGIDVANGKWWDMSGKRNHGTIYGATEVKLVEEEIKVK